jgi:transcriptional regulator with XRE-family HTH domain
MQFLFDADRIKQTRESKNMTVSSIARKLNISRQQYSAWETGKRTPNAKSLGKIASVLELSPDMFFKLKL